MGGGQASLQNPSAVNRSLPLSAAQDSFLLIFLLSSSINLFLSTGSVPQIYRDNLLLLFPICKKILVSPPQKKIPTSLTCPPASIHFTFSQQNSLKGLSIHLTATPPCSFPQTYSQKLLPTPFPELLLSVSRVTLVLLNLWSILRPLLT